VRIPSIWRRNRSAIISIILGSSLRWSTSSASQVKLLQPKFVNGCPEVLFAEEWRMEIYGGDGKEWITSLAICSHCYTIPLRPNCYVISVGCSVMFVPSYPLVTQKQAGGFRRWEWIEEDGERRKETEYLADDWQNEEQHHTRRWWPVATWSLEAFPLDTSTTSESSSTTPSTFDHPML